MNIRTYGIPYHVTVILKIDSSLYYIPLESVNTNIVIEDVLDVASIRETLSVSE